MPRKLLVGSLLLVTAVFLILLIPAGVVYSQELMKVFVTNFPDLQRIRGSVVVEGPIQNAELVTLADITVSPVKPTDTTRLISAGSLSTDGYPYLVLSLSGQVKGTVYRAGTVGAILIPEQDPILRAFDEKGRIQFPLEVTASGVSGVSAYFASDPSRFALAFPSYRIFLYNTSDKTVTVNLYAYLTSG